MRKEYKFCRGDGCIGRSRGLVGGEEMKKKWVLVGEDVLVNGKWLKATTLFMLMTPVPPLAYVLRRHFLTAVSSAVHLLNFVSSFSLFLCSRARTYVELLRWL